MLGGAQHFQASAADDLARHGRPFRPVGQRDPRVAAQAAPCENPLAERAAQPVVGLKDQHGPSPARVVERGSDQGGSFAGLYRSPDRDLLQLGIVKGVEDCGPWSSHAKPFAGVRPVRRDDVALRPGP